LAAFPALSLSLSLTRMQMTGLPVTGVTSESSGVHCDKRKGSALSPHRPRTNAPSLHPRRGA